MSCIEALIQASNHETNDDDVDGRTPLLLACLNGHHQAVLVLLSLGGDVTKRSQLLYNYLHHFFPFCATHVVMDKAIFVEQCDRYSVSCRVVNSWNNLPSETVDFSTLEKFKCSLQRVDF